MPSPSCLTVRPPYSGSNRPHLRLRPGIAVFPLLRLGSRARVPAQADDLRHEPRLSGPAGCARRNRGFTRRQRAPIHGPPKELGEKVLRDIPGARQLTRGTAGNSSDRRITALGRGLSQASNRRRLGALLRQRPDASRLSDRRSATAPHDRRCQFLERHPSAPAHACVPRQAGSVRRGRRSGGQGRQSRAPPRANRRLRLAPSRRSQQVAGDAARRLLQPGRT